MRALVPQYYISIRPVGWKCSECGQVFLNRVEHSKENQPLLPSTQVEEKFAIHDCDIHRAEVRAYNQSMGKSQGH